MASRKFHGLDALRGIAAIAVMLFHSSSIMHLPWLFPSGYLAVDLFFVMSGFVIAYSYEERIRTRGIAWFLWVRLIRFAPLFYLGGLLGLLRLALLSLSGRSDVSALGIVPYFLFLPASPGSSPNHALTPLNGPGWSLLLEVYINLAYALVLPTLRTRVLVAITAFAGVALILLLATGEHVAGTIWSNLDSGIVLRLVFSFSCGVLLYRIHDRFRFSERTSFPLLAIAALAMMMPSSHVWDGIFILVLSPLLVVAAICCNRESALARYGATSSYCIYAVHVPLLFIASGTARKFGVDDLLSTLFAIAIILSVAPLIDRLFDVPARRWLTKRILGSSTKPPALGTQVRSQAN